MIASSTPSRHPAAPQDIINTIHRFRLGTLSLASMLDRLLDEIELLPDGVDLDIGELEDRWTDIEVISALAAEGGSKALNGEDAAKVHAAMDAMVDLATRAL